MQEFKTNDYVCGITVNLIDCNPYDKIVIDVYIGHLYVNTYEIPHFTDINDDHLGGNTAVYKTRFTPFRTNKMIYTKIKTKLSDEEKKDKKAVKIYLLTQVENLVCPKYTELYD